MIERESRPKEDLPVRFSTQ